MTPKDIMRTASSELSPFMKDYGYIVGRLPGRFIRAEGTLDKRITLVVCKWEEIGYHLDHYCEFRLPVHTEIHNRYLPYRTDQEKKLAPTISHYFFNLVPNTFDWKDLTVETDSDIANVVRTTERLCIQYSFPFLNRFASAEAIIQGFQGDRREWVVQDPILQHQLLLLDSVARKDASSFDHWFNETVRFCGNRMDGQSVGLVNLASALKRDFFLSN